AAVGLDREQSRPPREPQVGMAAAAAADESQRRGLPGHQVGERAAGDDNRWGGGGFGAGAHAVPGTTRVPARPSMTRRASSRLPMVALSPVRRTNSMAAETLASMLPLPD